MSTSQAKAPKHSTAEKSKADNIGSPQKNSSQISSAVATSAQSMAQGNSPKSAFYSAGPVAGLGSMVQAKLFQQQEIAEEQGKNTEEDTTPVQAMCAECEAELERDQNVQAMAVEDEAGKEETSAEVSADNAVQMWSCDDYPEPTCSIQSKHDFGSTIQFVCPDCEAELKQKDGDTVQSQQAEGDSAPETAEEKQGENDTTQLKEYSESSQTAEADEESAAENVQMWSCEDYSEPTCSIQSKEEPGSTVQFLCPECEAELKQGQDKNTGETDKHQQPVQKKNGNKQGQKPSVQATATRGLKHASHPLPHKDKIQAAFGRHDISDVRGEVGGAAGQASRRMGALAYTSGNRIGFRHSPSLHLAAHELAHVVQQRSGLKLPGNVGRPGDRWERHADQVADTVVAGKSAEPLLNEVAPTASRHGLNSTPTHGDGISGAVQHQITSGVTHHVEPPVGITSSEGGEEKEIESTGGVKAEAKIDTENTDAVEQETETNEKETSNPEEECKKSEGEDAKEKSPCEEKKGGKEAAPKQKEKEGKEPPPKMGRCYSSSEKPPKGAKKPKKDAPKNKVEEESDVSCGPWDEPDDKCECAVKKKVDQQTGGGTQKDSTVSAQTTEAGPAQNKGKKSEGQEAEGTSKEEGKPDAAKAEEGGGEGGGGASAAPSFQEGETTRDAAIAEFYENTAEVERVPGRMAKLSKGLRFTSTEPGSAEDSVRRAMALKQIQAFMLRTNTQVQGAVDFVSRDVPGRLGAMAESIKGNIEMSMAEQKAVISARIAQARKTTIAGALSARAAINASYKTSVTTVNTKSDAAISALMKKHGITSKAINTREGAALKEINTRFQKGRKQHDTEGDNYANQAIKVGQNWVSAYNKCRAGPGNDYKKNKDDGFWDGCLTVRRAKAQQDAACKTASGTAKNMKKTADKKGFKLRDQRTQSRCTAITGATESLATLDKMIDQLVSGLESGRKGILAGLEQARDMNLSAVEATFNATMAGLDRQEREQRQAVNDSGYAQQVAVEQLAHQVSAGLVKSVTHAMDSLEVSLQQLRERLTEGDVPPEEVLNEVLASAEKGLGGGVGTLLQKMEEGASNAEMQLMTAGSNAAGALAEISNSNHVTTTGLEQSFGQQMKAFSNAAKQSMSQLTKKFVNKVRESQEHGTTSMQKLVTGYVTTTEKIYEKTDSTIKTSLDELIKDLKSQKEGLAGKIAAEAWRAAEKEQPAWKEVVAILLIILIIVISVVASVLTAGAFGPIATILIAGVIGAITSGLIQIINNWAAGEEWDKGLVQAMVIGFAGGIIGGAFGAGASKLAGLAVNRAISAGASKLTRMAINAGINLAGDLLGEAATQTFNYVVYGQKFNWQGFAMAGGMSLLSTARGPGGMAGEYTPKIKPGTPRGPRAPLHAPKASDLAIGLGLAGGIEGANYLATGKFDAKSMATSFAGAAGGSWASRAGGAHGPSRGKETDVETPTVTSKALAMETPSTTPKAPAVETPGTTSKAPAVETSGTTPKAPVAEIPSTTPKAPAAETPSTTPKAPAVETPGTTPKAPTAETPSTTPKAPTAEAPGTTPKASAVEPAAQKTKAAEGETPAATKPTNEAEPNPKRSSHEDASEVEPGVVSKIETDDGHSVSVLKDGQIVTCSDCATLRMRYAEELSDPLNVAHKKELERIEKISDPEVKAAEAKKLRDALEVLRSSGISKAPTEAADASALAKLAGLPDAPAGKHWVKDGKGLALLPENGITIAQRIAEGGDPKPEVRKNPNEWYYDTKTNAYKLRETGTGTKVSLRKEYLGDTPGKRSSTGKEVIKRMRGEPAPDGPPPNSRVRGNEPDEEVYVKGPDGKYDWYPIKDMDMGHHPTDAVTWWNEVGRKKYGPRHEKVREWMKDSDHYELQHKSVNRSEGAKLGQTEEGKYKPPIDENAQD